MRFMLLVILLCLFHVESIATPPTPAEAKRLLKYPKGSLSLGFTNSGKLLNGATLPAEGPGFRIFSSFVKRNTNYGTRELIGLIQRAGHTVSKMHAGAVIGIGNLSRQGGGQTGSSVSHKSGRDADLGMFALTKKGESKNLGSFVSFEKDGWDKRKRYRFDPVRNLDLVLALVEDTKSPVQVIFVADWLKEILLREGRKRELAPARLAKIETVLKQPSDSNPHHHHYHVRLYCSVEDRLYGCLERGEVHPWVDHGDSAFQERVQKLVNMLSMTSAKWRQAGAKRLGELRAIRAILALVKSAEDPVDRVALTALNALGNMANPDAYEPLSELLKRSTSSKRIEAILGALLRIELPRLEETTLSFIKRLENQPSSWTPSEKLRLRLKALKVLQRFGRHASFSVVMDYLRSEDPTLLEEVHRTLRRITNQPLRGRFKARRHRKILRRTWGEFHAKHANDTWADWMRLGFKARGLKLGRHADDERTRSLLIKQLTARDDDAAHNAALTLMHHTGHTAYPWWRKKRNNRRHWESWFRKPAIAR